MKVGKCIMLGILIFLICTTVLMASETRLMTLGYNTIFYVGDSYDIWMFPSTVVNYQNMVFAESSVYNQLWSGGVHIPISPTIVVGLYTSNEKADISYTDTDYLGDQADHQFDIFLGVDGANTDFGLHLQTFSRKATYTNAANSDLNWEEKLGRLGFEGGISHKMNPQTRLDATIFYQSSSFANVITSLDPDQYLEPYKYSYIGVGARLFYALSPRSMLVPFVSYASGGEGYQWLVTEANNPIGDPYKSYREAGSMYVVGVAYNLIPKAKNLVTLAAGIEGMSGKPEVTYYTAPSPLPVQGEISYGTLPFINIGLESRIAKWLDARFSFYELLYSDTEKDPVSATQLDEFTEKGSSYAANFGLAFHLKNFDVDVLIDTDAAADFLHYGPYILSGHNYDIHGLFSQVSVTYRFGKDEKKE